MENQSPIMSELSGLWPYLTGAAGAIVAGFGFAFATGRKAQAFKQNGLDIAALREQVKVSDEKRDAQFKELMNAVTLVGTADAYREAQVESLRRDVDDLKKRVNAA